MYWPENWSFAYMCATGDHSHANESQYATLAALLALAFFMVYMTGRFVAYEAGQPNI